MKEQKVAIVGAGICGLYLAKKLSKKHQVTIFEKKKKIGKYACSGLFSEKILSFIPESRKLIKNRISSALLHFSKKEIKLNFPKDFLVIDHFKLDQLVVKLIDKDQVKILLNREIEAIPSGFDRVIGCDGANSIVRKKVGLQPTKCRIGIQGFLKKKDSSGFVEVWPTENGFIWKIPRGNEIEYGIIEEVEKAQKLLNNFLKEKDIQLKETRSALIPEGFQVPSSKKITLCGDALGLTKPWSGGGVIWGLTAADILLKNFPDFLNYKKKVERFFKFKILFSRILTKLVYFFGFNFPFIIPSKVEIENDFLIFNKNE